MYRYYQARLTASLRNNHLSSRGRRELSVLRGFLLLLG